MTSEVNDEDDPPLSASFDTASSREASVLESSETVSAFESDSERNERSRRRVRQLSERRDHLANDNTIVDDDNIDVEIEISRTPSPAPHAPQQTEPAGFAHNEAAVKLAAALESAVQEANFSSSRALRKWAHFGWRGLCALVALALLVVAAATRRLAWIEVVVLLVVLALEAGLSARRQQRQKLFVCERAARHVAALRRGGKQHAAFAAGPAAQRTPSLVLASCKRGGTWSALPVQLLVEGDVIALDPHERAPCASHALGGFLCRLKAGEAFPGDTRTFFIVDETPAVRYFAATVAAVNSRRPSRLALAWRMLAWRVFRVGAVLALLALIAGIVRCVVSEQCESHLIGELIFSRPAAVWIAAMGFGNQLLQLIVYGVANAQLVTLFEVLERRALDKANGLAAEHAEHHDGDAVSAEADAGSAAAEANSTGRRSAGASVDSANSSQDSAAGESARSEHSGPGEFSSDSDDKDASSSSSTEEGDAAYEHAELRAIKHTPLPWRDVLASFWRVATSRHEFVGPYDSAPFHLGSASAVLVIDKCGVMAEPMALPVRVLLPQYVRRRKVTDTSLPEADRIADFGVTLQLHRPSTTSRHSHLEQTDIATHLSALKPIGLNVLLERPCRQPPQVLHRLLPRYVQAPLHLHDQCLCAFGREIGFTDAAMVPFAPVRVVFVSFAAATAAAAPPQVLAGEPAAPPSPISALPLDERYTYRLMTPPGGYGLVPPAMQALVTQQSPSGALQLLSRGNAVSVLDHCSHRFDGGAVRVLTQAERRSLLASDAALRRQGKGSLAFAYKPVPHEFYSLLHADAPADGDDGGAAAPNAALAALTSGQVFIGMVSVSLVPRVSPTFVQALRSGGVRFKYMSPDSTRATVAFAGKLGLETEWSFVISLKEPTAHDNSTGNHDDSQVSSPLDDYDSGLAARFASQVDQLNVKPPSGVAEVRRYIEQTQDDMPLRVSVHTNCTKKSITDMIQLMQEQGEIVAVVGASTNSSSSEPYGAADFAFAVPPKRPECIDTVSSPPAWLARERRHELHYTQHLPAVSLLASLPCAFVAHSSATDTEVLLALHLHARAIVHAVHRVSVLAATATSLVVLLLSVGHLLSWMSPLEVWHVFAIAYGAMLPLAVGQLLRAADPTLARRLPGKYVIREDQAGKLGRALLIVLLPTLVQLLFVFGASLYSLLDEPQRALWESDGGSLWLGVGSISMRDALKTPLAYARNVTWLALVCDLMVCALLINCGGRRLFTHLSPLWLPLCMVVLLPPVVVVVVDPSVAQIEWYVWLVLLAWPTLFLFPLAVLARRIYWYWYEKYQAFLQMEFNTVLPAWSPQIANKEQTDQVAKYGGHRASNQSTIADDW